MPRVHKAELLEIEMMAELVAEGAQERTERRDFLPHRRSHPYPDNHGFVGVVPEKLGAPPLADSERPCCKHADATSRDFVEPRCGIQKFCAGTADIGARPILHRGLYDFCNRQQASILRQVECPDP